MLLSAIKTGQLQIDLWSILSDSISVEILAASGLDWILLDTEHAPNELSVVSRQLQAVDSGTAHPIVLPPWNDVVMIKRFIDVGAQTLLIPMVQTGEEARRAVAATRYPLLGIRGLAPAARASGFGRITGCYERCEEQICAVVQIETQMAVDNLEEIAGVEGIDGLFIGPGDLSADLGYLEDSGHPDVVRVIDDAISRIGACDKPATILTNEDLAQHISTGGVCSSALVRMKVA